MKEEIKKAIAAHGMWKSRLQNAMDTGHLEVPVATIRVDNQCDFGKWLYGTNINPQLKLSDHYKQVKELHAHFHQIAAKVADLILAGKKAEAGKMMDMQGDYTTASEKLTKNMMDWYKS